MDLYQVASALNTISSANSSTSDRNSATEFLTKLTSQPNAAQGYVKIIFENTATLDLKFAAALHFKILITKNWNPDVCHSVYKNFLLVVRSAHVHSQHQPDSPFPTICDEDKNWIKQNIVDLALKVPDSLEKFFFASIRQIAIHDFPDKWQTVIPLIYENLKSTDHRAILKNLKILNILLKPYRIARSCDTINMQLLDILKHLAMPIKVIFNFYSDQVDNHLNNADTLLQLFEVIYLIFEIFYSLNSVDLPSEFEEFLEYWIKEHCKYINFTTQHSHLMPSADNFDGKYLLLKIKSSAVRNMGLFVGNYNEDVQMYIRAIFNDVCSLINQVFSLPPEIQHCYDRLVVQSLKLFSRVATIDVDNPFSSNSSILQGFFNSMVMPNFKFPSELQDTFESEPLEYIRFDIEQTDTFNRRNSAADLVKALRKHFDTQTTNMSLQEIDKLLRLYDSNPAENWMFKNQATHLLFSLTVNTESKFHGAMSINPAVPLEEFLLQSIVPELKNDCIDRFPIIKSDALHFIYLFRSHLSKFYSNLIPLLAKFLQSKYSVVASYAAITINSLVTLRNFKNINQLLLPQVTFEPHFKLILYHLFKCVSNNSGTAFDNENSYMALALAHVIFYSRNIILQSDYSLIHECLTQLTTKLSCIYKTYYNSDFVHHLFDCIACIFSILKQTNNTSWIVTAEEQLTPVFNTIINEDIIDLIPYVFQIMAQFIEIRKDQPEQLVSRYGSHLVFFLDPANWERLGNVPALTKLVSSFIKIAPYYIVNSGILHKILAIAKGLNDLRGYDQYGFEILKSILLHMDKNFWINEESAIYNLFFNRLRTNKTPGYINNLLKFWSELIYARDVEFVHHGMQSVQPGILLLVLKDIIIPSLPSTPQKHVHDIAVGMMKLWAHQILRNPPYVTHRPALTLAISKMITKNQRQVDETDVLTIEEIGGFTNEFSKLTFIESEDRIIDKSINVLALWKEQCSLYPN